MEEVSKSDVDEQRETELGILKSKTEDEFLIKIGAKEEEIIWDPKIINEPLVRSRSFVCAEYHKPANYRSRTKTVSTSVWVCDSQACRQLSLLPRFGPKKFYINNQSIQPIGNGHLLGSTTQALGVCFKPKTVTNL